MGIAQLGDLQLSLESPEQRNVVPCSVVTIGRGCLTTAIRAALMVGREFMPPEYHKS